MELFRFEIPLAPESAFIEHIRVSKKVKTVLFRQYDGFVEEIAEILKLPGSGDQPSSRRSRS
jgi:hypothetical protein